ncbi:MAG: hypothetical protein LQ346_006764 [Caloplaca aetnensis]|nr:MAG: hypothetical protein LQ346_006764 [Caloplaca aetnensis]
MDHKQRPQILYQYSRFRWKMVEQKSTAKTLSSTFRLITWNIDFQAPSGAVRMAAALLYLERLIAEAPPELPVVVMLQEMTPTDLKLIQSAAWVRQQFNLTDIDTSNWQGGIYGTAVLIDRRLPVKTVYRVFYETNMQRDGLFVDLIMKRASDQHDPEAVIRVCCTHLESLRSDPPLRPAQVAVVAQQLHESSVHGGLVAGDLNAIQDFDRTLHAENNLKDAYLELGGQEDHEEGYTWGQQVRPGLRERYGCTRMDKVLYCGRLRVERLQRIGIGVMVEESERAKLREAGAMEYVTDHYGLMTDIVVE